MLENYYHQIFVVYLWYICNRSCWKILSSDICNLGCWEKDFHQIFVRYLSDIRHIFVTKVARRKYYYQIFVTRSQIWYHGLSTKESTLIHIYCSVPSIFKKWPICIVKSHDFLLKYHTEYLPNMHTKYKILNANKAFIFLLWTFVFD